MVIVLSFQNHMEVVKRGFFVTIMLLAFLMSRAQTNTFPSSGNVSIGLSNPSQKLVVNGNVSIFDGGSFKVLSSIGVLWANTSILTRGYITQDYTDLLVPGSEPNSAYLRLNANGNVGIGIPNPDSKLSVNGTVRAREIKVDNSNWPDYVFKSDYELPTLKNIENFIKKNGRLLDMPSQIEVAKNGINLGEMNAKLLQKIEELTLYLITLKKENEQFKKDIMILKSKLD